jgi:hypothetical protein
MGAACGTRDGGMYKFLWENLNERGRLGDLCMISGFHREVVENCALLGCCAASSANPYRRCGTTYRSHFQGSVDSSPLKMGQTICPERSVKELPLFAA